MIELEAENFRVAYWRPDEHLNFFFFQQFFLDFEILGPKVGELWGVNAGVQKKMNASVQ